MGLVTGTEEGVKKKYPINDGFIAVALNSDATVFISITEKIMVDIICVV